MKYKISCFDFSKEDLYVKFINPECQGIGIFNFPIDLNRKKIFDHYYTKYGKGDFENIEDPLLIEYCYSASQDVEGEIGYKSYVTVISISDTTIGFTLGSSVNFYINNDGSSYSWNADR